MNAIIVADTGPLIDEKRGRRVATCHHIKITGTAAVLIKAKQNHFISEIKPLLETLSTHGYRLGPKLIEQVLIISGESDTETH